MKESKLRTPFEEEEVENNWAISYGDMITLLLGFFVIFFNIKSDNINLTLIKKDIDKVYDSAKGEVNRSLAEVRDQKDKQTPPIISTDVQNSLKIKSNIEGERILVEFPGVSFFNSSSHHLTKEGKAVLTDFSKAIDQHLGMFRLVVRGYTDALPLSSQSRYTDNLELSAFRSISAIRFLAEKGVKLENMRIAGYGESSMNRKEIDKKNLDDQRKIVIVIEPLDHTERVGLKKGDGFSDKAKGIEDVMSAKINDREPASVRAEKVAQNILNSINRIDTKEIGFNMRYSLYELEGQLANTAIYKHYLDFLMMKNLSSKGYTQKEIREILEKNENEGRVDK